MKCSTPYSARAFRLSSLFTILGALPTWAQSPSGADVANAAVAKIASQKTTFLDLIISGGWAMIPLGAMSVLMVMLVFFFLLTLRKGAVVSNQFMNTAELLLQKRDYSGLLAIANRHSEAIARILQRMLDFSIRNPGASFEVVKEIAQTEGSAQAASLQSRITYLADIAVLSPMVGLLGTVFGIIQSFGVLGSAVSSENRSSLLADGVSEALVATGAGLIIGIISMAFYGFFRNRVQRLISELERASAHALGLMALNFDKRAPVSSGKSAASYREEIPGEPSREPSSGSIRKGRVSVDDEF